MSRPTRNQCTSAWYPPRAVIPTFVVGGGGPLFTPRSATRSTASCSKDTSFRIAVTYISSLISNVYSKQSYQRTSELKYHGPCISYKSCDLQVSTLTIPPLPLCFVITTSPPTPISAIGYPISNHFLSFKLL